MGSSEAGNLTIKNISIICPDSSRKEYRHLSINLWTFLFMRKTVYSSLDVYWKTLNFGYTKKNIFHAHFYFVLKQVDKYSINKNFKVIIGQFFILIVPL